MTVAEMTVKMQERLGDDPNAAQQYYNASECLIWLNVVQRLFCFLTFDQEITVTFPLRTDGTAFYKMLNYYADWLVPLRVRVTGGYKLRPARLVDLASLDANWSVSRGTPIKYALLGFDLLAVYNQPDVSTSVDITYVQNPPNLVLPTDSPVIPSDYHGSLIDGAEVLARAKEGANESEKTIDLWARYTDACKAHAAYVRARNIEQGYDYQPPELERFDMSRVPESIVKG